MRGKLILFVLAILAFTGCSDSDYPGYDRLKDSVHYRILTIGDEGFKVRDADHLSFSLTVLDQQDTKIAVKQFKRINLAESTLPKYLSKVLREANEDDSISFIGTANDLMVNTILGADVIEQKEPVLRVELMINEALTDARLREVQAHERLLRDYEINEQLNLSILRDSLDLTEEDEYNGIYFKLLEGTNGKKPKTGEYIRVNYVATLFDGTVIDDTYKGEPLEYELGRPDQVLRGFGVGISKMKVGDRALMVVPSMYGFGEKGSSSGIVPPFHTIIYEARLEAAGF